jgi:fructose-bisphosphate aldolase class I
MESTVAALLASGKGILAADESFRTIEKRLRALDIPPTDENRRAYRELLVSTPSLGEFVGGVILFDETIRQRTAEQLTIPEVLAKQGILTGIKVDKGTAPLVNFPGERVTEGLDGLRERLIEYRALGARFTKWRAVFAVGETIPSRSCIETNARSLALFAALSQEAGLVPIVEPEVLMDGDHTIEHCEDVATVTLGGVFDALFDQRVVLERMLLKTAMVLPGAECLERASLAVVAGATLRCLGRTVPAAVPGIVFLSGGQEAGIATERLNAICRASEGPWTMTFSFGRALQVTALNAWKGDPGNIQAAQDALRARAHDNSLAVQGTYSPLFEEGKSFASTNKR